MTGGTARGVGKGGLVVRVAGGAALLGLIVAIVFVALLVTIASRRSAVDSARRSAAVVTRSFEAQKLVVDAETGTRGYLLTSERRFLAPYTAASRALPGQLAALERSVRDDPAQLARARAIGGAVADYLHGWAGPAIASDATGRRRATLAQGKRLVDGIRGRFAAFDAVQRRVAYREASHAEALATLGVVLGGGGVGVALVLTALYAVYGARMVAPVRRVARAAHRLADGDLDVRVAEGGSAEVAELSAAFNVMATALQDGREELETQHAELEAQHAELQDALGRVERFHAFAHALATHTDLAPLAETVLEFLCAEVGADAGVLYVRNPVVHEYQRAAERGDEHAARHRLSLSLPQAGAAEATITLGRLGDRPFSGAERAAAQLLADQAAPALVRARMQRQTERSLRTVQLVLDAAPAAIALIGLDGATAFENPTMSDLRRRAGGDEAARRSFDAPGTDAARRASDELELEGGQRVFARYAAPLTGLDGSIIGRIVVLRDVSAEREADRLKDEFFALVSHELRTPLTSIVGYLEMTLEEEDEIEPLDPQRRHFLEVVDRNAKRLLRLVGDLLFVAQVEAGTLSLTRGRVDLARAARQAVETAAPHAAAAGIALELDVRDEAEAADADAERIGQMIDNLIANALKFTPEGGTVSVRLSARGGSAELEVSDTGVGIAPADQSRLFERFYRTADAAERGVPGVGLGLTIVQAIARGHGGDSLVASAPGEGTTFTVRLPLAGAVSAPAARSRAVAAPEG